MDENYINLLEYVKHNDLCVRNEAYSILSQLFSNSDSVNVIKEIGKPFCEILLDQKCTDALTCEPALLALVNLTADIESSNDAIFIICLLLRYVTSNFSEINDNSLTLLLKAVVNLSRAPTGINEFVKNNDALILIFKHFKKNSQNFNDEFVLSIAKIILNLSFTCPGRKFITDNLGESCMLLFEWKTPGLLAPTLIHFIKNLAIDRENLSLMKIKWASVFIFISRVIYPSLRYLEGLPDKNDIELRLNNENITRYCSTFLEDEDLRAVLIFSLMKLLSVQAIRETARDLEFYEILRVWHLLEINDKISLSIQEIVHLVHYSEEELTEQDRALQP